MRELQRKCQIFSFSKAINGMHRERLFWMTKEMGRIASILGLWIAFFLLHNAMILKKFIISFLTILSCAYGYDNRSPIYDLKEMAAIGQLVAILPPNAPGFSSQYEMIQKRFKENSKKGLTTRFVFCTAVLFTSDKIATAGHCGKYYDGLKKINIKVEFVSADKESGNAEVKSIFSMEGKTDWAVLSLEKPFSTIKPMQFFRLRKIDEQKITLLSVGYPLIVNGREYFGETLFSSQCVILPENEKKAYSQFAELQYDLYLSDCYVTEGNSGGPILIKAGAGYYIIGINSFNLVQGRSVRALSVPARVILNAIKE